MQKKEIARFFLIAFGAILLGYCASASNQFYFQGRLTDSATGNPIVAGVLDVSLFSSSSGGASFHTESFPFANANGYFSVLVGSTSALNLNYGTVYYLDMAVNGNDFNFGALDRLPFESTRGTVSVSSIPDLNSNGDYRWVPYTGANRTVALGANSLTSLQDGNFNRTCFSDGSCFSNANYCALSDFNSLGDQRWYQFGQVYFVNLADVPHSYVGEAGKLVRVNPAENGLDFIDTNLAVTDVNNASYLNGYPSSAFGFVGITPLSNWVWDADFNATYGRKGIDSLSSWVWDADFNAAYLRIFVDTNWQTSFDLLDANLALSYYKQSDANSVLVKIADFNSLGDQRWVLLGTGFVDTNWQTSFNLLDQNLSLSYYKQADANAVFLKIDGSSTTTARIPFAQSIRADSNILMPNGVWIWRNAGSAVYPASIVIGDSTALNDKSVTIGDSSTNSGYLGTMIGSNSTLSNAFDCSFITAIGNQVIACANKPGMAGIIISEGGQLDGQGAICIGETCNASDNYAMAIGGSAFATKPNSGAFGQNVVVNGPETFAFGKDITVSDSNVFQTSQPIRSNGDINTGKSFCYPDGTCQSTAATGLPADFNVQYDQRYYTQTDANNVLVKKADYNSFGDQRYLPKADLNAQYYSQRDANAVLVKKSDFNSLAGQVCLKLDQTTSQTVVNGTPTFQGLSIQAGYPLDFGGGDTTITDYVTETQIEGTKLVIGSVSGMPVDSYGKISANGDLSINKAAVGSSKLLFATTNGTINLDPATCGGLVFSLTGSTGCTLPSAWVPATAGAWAFGTALKPMGRYWGTDGNFTTSLFAGTIYSGDGIRAETNITANNNILAMGDLNSNKNLGVDGNIIGNQFFGGMYGNEISQAVVVAATNTYYEVGGSLTAEKLNGFKFSNSKDLNNTVAGTYLVNYSMTINSATNSQDLSGAVMVNGVAQTNTTSHNFNGTGASKNSVVAGTGIITVSANSQFNLAVANHTATNNIVVEHANFTALRIGT